MVRVMPYLRKAAFWRGDEGQLKAKTNSSRFQVESLVNMLQEAKTDAEEAVEHAYRLEQLAQDKRSEAEEVIDFVDQVSGDYNLN